MRMFCYFFVMIFENVSLDFLLASSNDLIDIDICALCYTARIRPRTMMRKLTISFTVKISLMHCIDGSLFRWFSEGDNGLVYSQPLILILRGSIFL